MLLVIIIYNIFNFNIIEKFTSTNALPNIISASNFNQYFTVDSGIANCNNESGCPKDAINYIADPGKIIWKNGQSPTFRTKNAVLPSGTGFVGFKLNSVPMDNNIWNSIWLMGKNMGHSTCGPCLEIDIYELMNQWWNGVPKISFHDWPNGKGASPKNEQGCFGIYLNGNIGDGTCSNKYGNIIKNWNWNSIKSKIYTGATWFTLVTKDSKGTLVYVGISLNGWLPKTKSEATYENIFTNSDFLLTSGSGNIKGDPKGGFFFCLTSTNSGNNNLSSKYWDIPEIVNFDGLSNSSSTTPATHHSSSITPATHHSSSITPATHHSSSITPATHHSSSKNKHSICYSTICKIDKDSSNENTIGHLVNPGNISFDDCKEKCDDDVNCNYFKSGPGEWCEKFYDNKFPNKNAWELFINNNNIPKFKSRTGNTTYYTGLPSKYCCN
jgi:hypothetical protein